MIKPNSVHTFYQIISAAFCVIVVISNVLSAKMIQLPYFEAFEIPAGLMFYPLTFLLSDLVTEVYGSAKAKLMVYVAFAMNILSFAFIEIALLLPSQESQNAFHIVLGLSGIRIFASLTAYLAAQIVDIRLYVLIKNWTNERFLWLRNNGSTCISQIVDTVLVDLIYLYWGMGMPLGEVAPIMLFSYAYKAFFSVASTPFFYLCVFLTKVSSNNPNKILLFRTQE